MMPFNEYLNIMREIDGNIVNPPFTEEQIEAAEYFNVTFDEVLDSHCLHLLTAEGDEIAKAYWESWDFMVEYMEEFYDIELDEESMDSLIDANGNLLEDDEGELD
jgi:hypothetical protein